MTTRLINKLKVIHIKIKIKTKRQMQGCYGFSHTHTHNLSRILQSSDYYDDLP